MINISLNHHSPIVRKEGEQLFITLFAKMNGSKIEQYLKNLKKNQMNELIDKAKKHCGFR